jgi:hypothetical protein
MADLGTHAAFFPAYLASSFALLHYLADLSKWPQKKGVDGYLRLLRFICLGVG